MSILEAVVIAIVEGLTEFLPVSSTGHMILTSTFLGIQAKEFTKLFEVAIQFGAILAVVILYYKKFFDFAKWQFYAKLIVGVVPALLLGYLFSDKIDELMASPLVVVISMLVGGIILVLVDDVFKNPTIDTDTKMSFGKSFIVGIWQTIAMIPGVSRSAATIIGGMSQKFSRQYAAEFSFFLAVPTMAAATAYSLFLKKWGQSGTIKKGYELILESKENTVAFTVGSIVAFIVAVLAVKFFITFLKKYGFKVFGWYRIIVGIILLILLLLDVIQY